MNRASPTHHPKQHPNLISHFSTDKPPDRQTEARGTSDRWCKRMVSKNTVYACYIDRERGANNWLDYRHSKTVTSLSRLRKDKAIWWSFLVAIHVWSSFQCPDTDKWRQEVHLAPNIPQCSLLKDAVQLEVNEEKRLVCVLNYAILSLVFTHRALYISEKINLRYEH